MTRLDVFMTGATGYVGSRVAAALVARGHRVRALQRSERPLPAGVEAVPGRLEEPEAVAVAARGADRVLHLGFPQHGLAWSEGVEVERRFLEVLTDRWEGASVVASNGSLFLGPSNPRHDEWSPVDPASPASIRAAATHPVTHTPALRGVELRLASFVYGGGGSVFLPILVEHARRSGEALYVDGAAHVSAVHVDAAAEAYVLAAESGTARGVYHVASDEEPTIYDLSRAVAASTGAEPRSVTLEEASARLDPFTAMFLATDNRLSSDRIRGELGWSHRGHPSLLWDVAHGSYASGDVL
ncbi:MAG: NAD-dependent epimerase/dehydratase family protein [Myxococcota bacterium]